MTDLRYRAFISYSRADRESAKRLQKLLEAYVLPSALRATGANLRLKAKALKPIFRDEDELVPGADLSERITKALKASEYLIVVCSPAARRSHWVNTEVEEFTRLHQEDSVLAVVVAGEPDAANRGLPAQEECLPPALRTSPDREVLWVDWRKREANNRTALLRVVAAILGLQSLDDLVHRDAQRRRRSLVIRCLVAAVVCLIILAVGEIGVRNRQQALTAQGHATEVGLVARNIGSNVSAAEVALARFVVLKDINPSGNTYASDWQLAGFQIDQLAELERNDPAQERRVSDLRRVYNKVGDELTLAAQATLDGRNDIGMAYAYSPSTIRVEQELDGRLSDIIKAERQSRLNVEEVIETSGGDWNRLIKYMALLVGVAVICLGVVGVQTARRMRA